MGTMFYYDEMLPNSTAYPKSERRQVEVFRPSGTSEIHLRIGFIDEEHQGRGHGVELSEEAARELIDGIETAFAASGRQLFPDHPR